MSNPGVYTDSGAGGEVVVAECEAGGGDDAGHGEAGGGEEAEDLFEGCLEVDAVLCLFDFDVFSRPDTRVEECLAEF